MWRDNTLNFSFASDVYVHVSRRREKRRKKEVKNKKTTISSEKKKLPSIHNFSFSTV
jgi:hypothetical protein